MSDSPIDHDNAMNLMVKAKTALEDGNFEQAVELAKKGKKLYEEASNNTGIINCTIIMAQAYRLKGQLDEAISFILEAHQSAKQEENPLVAAKVCYYAAFFLSDAARYPEARKYCEEVISTAEGPEAKDLLRDAKELLNQINTNLEESKLEEVPVETAPVSQVEVETRKKEMVISPDQAKPEDSKEVKSEVINKDKGDEPEQKSVSKAIEAHVTSSKNGKSSFPLKKIAIIGGIVVGAVLIIGYFATRERLIKPEGSVTGQDIEKPVSDIVQITAIDPSEITLGQQASITIIGQHLEGATAVSIDRAAVVENPPEVSTDGSRLTVRMKVLENEAPGPAVVTLHTSQGSMTTGITLVEKKVIAEPVIISIDPPRLTLGERAPVAITGQNLEGATAVSIDRAAIIENPPEVSADGTRLTVYITVSEDQPPGTAVVIAYTPRGNSTGNMTLVEKAPVIEATVSSIHPSGITMGKEEQIKIIGENLQGATEVTIDRTATVKNPPSVSADGTQLTVRLTVPKGQKAGSATVMVHTSNGNPIANISLIAYFGQPCPPIPVNFVHSFRSTLSTHSGRP